jgi:hypothetical protein
MNVAALIPWLWDRQNRYLGQSVCRLITAIVQGFSWGILPRHAHLAGQQGVVCCPKFIAERFSVRLSHPPAKAPQMGVCGVFVAGVERFVACLRLQRLIDLREISAV